MNKSPRSAIKRFGEPYRRVPRVGWGSIGSDGGPFARPSPHPHLSPAGLFGKDRPPTIVKPERASPRMERFMHKLNAERVADDVVRPPPPKSLKKKENRLTLGQVGVATWFHSTKPPFTSYNSFGTVGP